MGEDPLGHALIWSCSFSAEWTTRDQADKAQPTEESALCCVAQPREWGRWHEVERS